MSLIGATGGVIGAAGVAAGGSSYLVEEDFEGTGAPDGWTTINSNGTIDYDSTTSPLRGSQSLRLTKATSNGVSVYKAFTAQSTVHVFARVRWSANFGDSSSFLILADSSGNEVASVQLRLSGGPIRIYHGSSWSATSASPSAGTTYYLWLTYTAGTGSNGALSLYLSESATKPGTASAAVTDGTSTADAGRLWLNSSELVGDIDYDQILVSDEEIGNVDA